MKHYFALLIVLLLGTGVAWAQNEVPQVFSPNAAELGKYGKVPVSYFNGLPSITIPLTELKGKNYTLPVYLSYHAGGNKPDQHPGWVGLGWSLQAGGCITRIQHDDIDELSHDECLDLYGFWGPDAGYLSQVVTIPQAQIDSAYLADYSDYVWRDMAPDEFQVSFEGLSSSFYFVGENEVKIASESNLDYTVEVEIGSDLSLPMYDDSRLRARQYPCITTIYVTTSDGVVYRFGGEEDAIEYYYDLVYPVNSYSAILKRTPTSWNITSITYPNGEEFLFEYVKDGTPIITTDRHYIEHCQFDPGNPSNPSGYLINTYTQDTNIHHYLLSPSYLSRISALKTGEELIFSISETEELADTVDERLFRDYFCNRAGLYYSECVADNHYQQLDSIETPQGNVYFQYTNSTGERLKLLQVNIGGDIGMTYWLQYNNLKLPEYHSRQTDMWGYYSQSTVKDETGVYFQVDSVSCQAEILQSIQYPTGGQTLFEYEPHDYNAIASQYPFILMPEDGIAGGLRIKKMTDITGDKQEERLFRYVDENGNSSGVSAVKPRFEAEGEVYIGQTSTQVNWGAYLPQFMMDTPYYLFGERPLNQIPLTKGCHVSYSRVEECFPDSSKVVYCFTNHEDNPDEPFVQAVSSFLDYGLYNSFSSHALSRGLLSRKETYAKNRTSPVKVEEYQYMKDSTDRVMAVINQSYCMGTLRRTAQIYYYTYFPGLSRKTEVFYPEGAGEPLVITTDYTYDFHRRLISTSRRVGNVTDSEIFTYTGNYTGVPYADMKQKNMISYPVEHLLLRQEGTTSAERVVGAELTTWKKQGTQFVPQAQYIASLGEGIPLALGSSPGFHPLESTGQAPDASYGAPALSFSKYDGFGNLTLSEDRSGLPVTYVWTEDGCHPAAIFTGAKNSYRTIETVEEVTDCITVDLNGLSYGTSIDLEFNCASEGWVSVFISFIKDYGRDIWWRMDLGAEHKWNNPYINVEADEEMDIEPLFSGVLPAGEHLFQITAVQGEYSEPALEDDENEEEEDDPGENNGPSATAPVRMLSLLNPSWGTLELQYPTEEHAIVEVRADECLFDSGTYSGLRTLDFVPHPEKTYVVDWQQLQPDGSWKYSSKTVQGAGTITAGSAGRTIRHIRVYALGASAESFDWDEVGNLISRTDSQGVTRFYRYDSLGRLIGTYDNNNDIVESYQYHYNNQ